MEPPRMELPDIVRIRQALPLDHVVGERRPWPFDQAGNLERN